MSNLKLITEHKDYLLLVDTEAKITKGSYFLLGDKYINRYEGTNEERYKTHLSEPIIAHLPLNNAPKLEGVPLLPELPQKRVFQKCHFQCGDSDLDKATCQCYNDFMQESELPKQEEDIDKKAHEAAKESFITFANINELELFKTGYKAAASKKWSDGDMINFPSWMREQSNLEFDKLRQRRNNPKEDIKVLKSDFKIISSRSNKEWLELYKQSLSPKLTPIGFEPELHWKDTLLPYKDLTKRQYNIVNGVLQGTYKF